MDAPAPVTRVSGVPEVLAAGERSEDLGSLVAVVNRHAEALGTGRLLAADFEKPLVGTGHQAFFHHPGILAKDLFLDEVRSLGAGVLHVVVDQDTQPVWSLDVPEVAGERLSVRAVVGDERGLSLPTGQRKPSSKEALAAFRGLGVGALDEAVADGLPGVHAAAQMTALLARLRWSDHEALPVLFVSDLAGLPGYRRLLGRLIAEAPEAMRAYNEACRAFPEAGVPALYADDMLVELPVWGVEAGRPRRRVFVDVADSEPLVVFEDGGAVDRSVVRLLPRALLLTGYLRSSVVDLFVHGTGGAVYDRITERWWERWRGERLASQAVVTADAYLDFPVPVSVPEELPKALWWVHHLKHNVDRFAKDADEGLVREKRGLIEKMEGLAGKADRAAAFARIHAINDLLCAQHAGLLEEADDRLVRVRRGLANRGVAGRRDWFFGLYPETTLAALRERVRAVLPGVKG
ncbi:hypothetical protein [Mucisphaera sp.]|uniref:hypothetical protein n=1 Tax=Mucisphaera sp. TaxID=2913024 RepID=UPI003D1411FF